MDFRQVSPQAHETGTNTPHERLAFEGGDIVARKPGYVYIYLSNEHETLVDVYFDDLKITHTHSPVQEETFYYPFGMVADSWRKPEAVTQPFLYNGKEKDPFTGWDDYGARMYMSDIGRWGVMDPLSEKYYSWTPYNYCLNNPVYYIDPDGRDGGHQYDVTKQTTTVKTVEIDGKKYTQLASTSVRTVSSNWEHSKSGPQPTGDITRTTSTTIVTINGDGEVVNSSFSETTAFKGMDDKKFKVIENRSGLVNLDNGTVEFEGGASQKLDVNFTSDVNKIAEFNKKNDIDFPRAVAQNVLDRRNDALGVIGLSPSRPVSILSYLAGKVQPTAEEIANAGFSIQQSSAGNVGEVEAKTVVRDFNSKLLPK